MDREAKRQQLEQLRTTVKQLEGELAAEENAGQWPPPQYYTAYHALAGFVLGMFGAATSLLFNVVGSVLIGQHPLQLIRVYLTFPLGGAALQINSGLTLAIGCCLYLGTGMLLGIPVYMALARFADQGGLLKRLIVASEGSCQW